MDILDDMGVSKLSAKVFFFKVNYTFKMRYIFTNDRLTTKFEVADAFVNSVHFTYKLL